MYSCEGTFPFEHWV